MGPQLLLTTRCALTLRMLDCIPHLFTLAPMGCTRAVCFLWHFPYSVFAESRMLSGIVPFPIRHERFGKEFGLSSIIYACMSKLVPAHRRACQRRAWMNYSDCLANPCSLNNHCFWSRLSHSHPLMRMKRWWIKNFSYRFEQAKDKHHREDDENFHHINLLPQISQIRL